MMVPEGTLRDPKERYGIQRNVTGPYENVTEFATAEMVYGRG